MTKQKDIQEESHEKKLWNHTNKLNQNNAAEYKHVALGLIFLKNISDAFEEHFQLLVEGKGKYAGSDPRNPEEYRAENIFFVPEKARWSHIQSMAKKPEIVKLINDAMNLIEEDNATLKGMLPKGFDSQHLDAHTLIGLINLIGTISRGVSKSKIQDILGFTEIQTDFKIKFLQAFNGDSIWISLVKKGRPLNILIDGGTSTTYSFKDKKDGKIKIGELQKLIDYLRLNDQKLDLVILTHIDDDHIDGFLKWFGKDENAIDSIAEIWFNSGRTIKQYLNDTESEIYPVRFKEQTTLTSVKQGVDFENYILKKGVWDERIIEQGDVINWNGISFKILSPSREKLKKLLKEWGTKAPKSLTNTSRKNDYKKTFKELLKDDFFDEDKDPYNGSSIAFILTNDEKNYLFLGDSHPSEIVVALKNAGYNKENRLCAEILKLSHHGSRKNTSYELLELIDTYNYVVSTNGDLHGHPDKVTFGRIIANNPKARIYFNYPNLITNLILEEDRENYPYIDFLGTELLPNL